MNFFEEATLRLKQQLGVTRDKEVAALLGLSPVAWVGRKKRENFPELELFALVAQRPDLGVDATYVLTGERLNDRDREVFDGMRQHVAETTDLDETEKAETRASLDRAVSNTVAHRKRRAPMYQRLTNYLEPCSDDAVRLFTQLANKLRSDHAPLKLSDGDAELVIALIKRLSTGRP